MSEAKPGQIYSLIPKIMAEIDPIAKEQVNDKQRYKFRGIDDVYNSIQRVLAKHGVFTVPTIIGRHREPVTSGTGSKGWLTLNQYRFRFYALDGSFVEAEADGEGIDYGDKGSNKCAAIAHKYALLQVFMIPTDDLTDPDSQSHDLRPQQGSPVAARLPSSSGVSLPKPTNAPRLPNPVQQQVVPQESGLVSDAQVTRLIMIAKDNGWTDEKVKEFIAKAFNLTSKKQLNQKQYNVVTEFIQVNPVYSQSFDQGVQQ